MSVKTETLMEALDQILVGAQVERAGRYTQNQAKRSAGAFVFSSASSVITKVMPST